MGRKAITINPKSGERVKLLCERQGITQKELAEKINYSERSISNIVTGTKGLSPLLAQAIITEYPEYRLQWLLGEDDIMTHDEWFSSTKNSLAKEKQMMADMLSAIILLATPLGPTIHRRPDGGIMIKVGRNELILTESQTNELVSQIRELINVRIRWLFHSPFPASKLVLKEAAQNNTHDGGENDDTQST